MTPVIEVDPATLHLPPTRRAGADIFKLAEQIRRFQDRSTGMPTVQVTRGAQGHMMISDGVTRASRIAKLRPGATISVEVIEERPNASFDHLPLVGSKI